MTWQQIFVLVCMLIGIVDNVFRARHQRKHAIAVFQVCFAIAWSVGYAFVLASAGFW